MNQISTPIKFLNFKRVPNSNEQPLQMSSTKPPPRTRALFRKNMVYIIIDNKKYMLLRNIEDKTKSNMAQKPHNKPKKTCICQ